MTASRSSRCLSQAYAPPLDARPAPVRPMNRAAQVSRPSSAQRLNEAMTARAASDLPDIRWSPGSGVEHLNQADAARATGGLCRRARTHQQRLAIDEDECLPLALDELGQSDLDVSCALGGRGRTDHRPVTRTFDARYVLEGRATGHHRHSDPAGNGNGRRDRNASRRDRRPRVGRAWSGR